MPKAFSKYTAKALSKSAYLEYILSPVLISSITSNVEKVPKAFSEYSHGF